MTIFFSIIFLISSISLIISVILQESKSEGLGAIGGGGSQGLWGKSKIRSFEAILSRITTISAIVFMISALILAAI
ncbi:preprotein translocase subunit SecG [Clostridium sp. Cult2]|uniref:preprotein translocase subunit SecG n=1 Tax=Clostridium sp. Cult2 TaxID=2079003 RepID=UPI001F004CE8|nr:preprotein translocase subunit SecG [Clostridium sp. Cult2]MCF6466649.1 preprotein translocase subunit SecG [Clostridium sp. Cult2]